MRNSKLGNIMVSTVLVMSWCFKGEAAVVKTCDQQLQQCVRFGYGSAGKICKIESGQAWDWAEFVKSCKGNSSQMCNNARVKGPQAKTVLDKCVGGIIMSNASFILKNCLGDQIRQCDGALDLMMGR